MRQGMPFVANPVADWFVITGGNAARISLLLPRPFSRRQWVTEFTGHAPRSLGFAGLRPFLPGVVELRPAPVSAGPVCDVFVIPYLAFFFFVSTRSNGSHRAG